jgi:predicted O-linked N-acetylglucosamine transferase (SPINDLY family)
MTPLPALSNGYVTFGSFNNPAKLSAMTLDVWAEVLKAVPESRLLLKYGGLDQPEDQGKYRATLGARGIEQERLLFSGWSKTPELLAAYGAVDLALDTMPYSGGLTTCEALWMGVPVITYPGKTFAGRHSTSHLTNAGLPQFVAEDRNGYVKLAAEWAGRPVELADIRMKLRGLLRGSELCNGETFAEGFLGLIRTGYEESGFNGAAIR